MNRQGLPGGNVDAEADVRHMRNALELAVGGAGWVSPNPLVGCIIVRQGKVVGRGYHQRFGGPHAEVHALREAGNQARGAALYVTLEPCCHTGKTPPCVEAIMESRVGRVIVAMQDPNPRVDGGGLSRLRNAGVEVTVGVCEAEAQRLNEAFVKHINTGQPFVTSKSAITLDGKIATRSGSSRWISGEAARGIAHRLRHASDAIVVGIGTASQDDPQLTTRIPGQRVSNPLRVVVDSTLRLSPAARLADVAEDRRTLVATTEQAADTKAQALRERGVEVIGLPAQSDGRVDLGALHRALGERGIASVLVEGGAVLTTALLEQRLIDKMVLFVAPKIIGGDGVSVFGPCGVHSMEQALRLRDLTSRSVGNDVMLEAYPAWLPLTTQTDNGEGNAR